VKQTKAEALLIADELYRKHLGLRFEHTASKLPSRRNHSLPCRENPFWWEYECFPFLAGLAHLVSFALGSGQLCSQLSRQKRSAVHSIERLEEGAALRMACRDRLTCFYARDSARMLAFIVFAGWKQHTKMFAVCIMTLVRSGGWCGMRICWKKKGPGSTLRSVLLVDGTEDQQSGL
jgi:hypothetical protein